MKHTGTIEIDCGDVDCGRCKFRDVDKCNLFEQELKLSYSYYCNLKRCQQCLETFKPVAEDNK